jgi:hypothetical protein
MCLLPFFVLCVFANLEANQFLPWKREALENCLWDAICNRVSAKYVGTMKCRFPLFFSPVGSGLKLGGFWLVSLTSMSMNMHYLLIFEI